MSGEHVIEFKRRIEALRADGITETNFEQDIELMTLVISFSACDADGDLLFDSPEEAQGLTRNNINVLMDIGNRALELSGVKNGKSGLTSEVADDLPNDKATSLPSDLPRNSGKRSRKS